MFKRSLLALCVLGAVTGCGLSGDDGQNGATGATGATGAAGQNGSNGSNGQDANRAISMSLIGRAVLNVESPEGAAEIVAYHQAKKAIYAINSSGAAAVVNVIPANQFDLVALTKNNEGVTTGTNLAPNFTLALNDHTAGDANSIAIHEGKQLLAVAMAAVNKTDTGFVAFYDIAGEHPVFIKNVAVGALPDMVTFNHDGSKVLVANEGEPSGDYTIDPEGSISIINITGSSIADSAVHLDFAAYNGQQAQLQAQGVVFANPTGRTINGVTINTTVAMDLEPEYIAVSKDDKVAYVTLQENNAVAIVDLTNNSLVVKGLGFKDWSQYLIDASDKDGGIHFARYPGLFGMYQPDTIASFQWKGANFFVTANEGDAREYFFPATDEADCLAKGGLEFDSGDGCLAFSDEIRAKDLNLAANFSYLNNDNSDLGRLKVSRTLGDADHNNQYEQLYSYGARSFTIWDQNGIKVFDSGDDMERITAAIHGAAFNNDEDENKGDARSAAKGPEPEALAIGKVGERLFAFIGTERMGGIFAYDISNPYQVKFMDYTINRGLENGATPTGDLAPEGMKFVAAEHSPTGQPLLIVGNEISGSVAVWQISEQ